MARACDPRRIEAKSLVEYIQHSQDQNRPQNCGTRTNLDERKDCSKSSIY
jgi:hypothetical protein